VEDIEDPVNIYEGKTAIGFGKLCGYFCGKNAFEQIATGRPATSIEYKIHKCGREPSNFLFANTPKGATSSTVTFSILQTAIENGLDPYRHLKHVFTEAPKLVAAGEDWVNALLPWNAPITCRAGAAR